MPFKPLFLVTTWGMKRRPSHAARYGAHSTEPLWKVGMISGSIPGQAIGFYFENKAEAEKFSLYQIYDPNKILHEANPNREYIAGEVYRSFSWGPTNFYTDIAVQIPVWIVPMADPVAGNYLDLQFPNERAARKYSFGHAYKLKDILGTTRALPVDISAALQAAGQKAAAASLASIHADQAILTSMAQSGIVPTAKEIATARADLVAGGSGTTYFATTPTSYLGLAFAGAAYDYFIVDGGSAGWYLSGPLPINLEIDNPVTYAAAGLVFFPTGTWTHPYNGFFRGVFANLISGPFLTVGLSDIG